jgi:hypothetical protein
MPSKKSSKKQFNKLKLDKGTLTNEGYHISKPELARHRALGKAIKKLNGLTIFRKLNIIQVLSKNTNPPASAVYRQDKEWVEKKYRYTIAWNK